MSLIILCLRLFIFKLKDNFYFDKEEEGFLKNSYFKSKYNLVIFLISDKSHKALMSIILLFLKIIF